MGLSVPAHRNRVPGAPVPFLEIVGRLCGTAYAVKKKKWKRTRERKRNTSFHSSPSTDMPSFLLKDLSSTAHPISQ